MFNNHKNNTNKWIDLTSPTQHTREQSHRIHGHSNNFHYFFQRASIHLHFILFISKRVISFIFKEMTLDSTLNCLWQVLNEINSNLVDFNGNFRTDDARGCKKLVLGTFIIELECRSYNVYNFEIIKNYTYTFFLMVFILKLYLFMIY